MKYKNNNTNGSNDHKNDNKKLVEIIMPNPYSFKTRHYNYLLIAKSFDQLIPGLKLT